MLDPNSGNRCWAAAQVRGPSVRAQRRCLMNARRSATESRGDMDNESRHRVQRIASGTLWTVPWLILPLALWMSNTTTSQDVLIVILWILSALFLVAAIVLFWIRLETYTIRDYLKNERELYVRGNGPLDQSAVDLWIRTMPIVDRVTLTIIPHTRKRLRALRRLRCPQCGFTLQDLPACLCPECGWGRVDTDSVSVAHDSALSHPRSSS